MNFVSSVAISLICFFTSVPLIASEDSVKVEIYSSFFSQSCNELLRCQIPVGIGKPIYKTFGLKKPQGAGSFSSVPVRITSEDITMRGHIYRVEKSQHTPQSEDYINIQLTLFKDKTPLTSCNFVYGLKNERIFPVGTCMDIAKTKTGYEKIGVSFHKPYISKTSSSKD